MKYQLQQACQHNVVHQPFAEYQRKFGTNKAFVRDDLRAELSTMDRERANEHLEEVRTLVRSDLRKITLLQKDIVPTVIRFLDKKYIRSVIQGLGLVSPIPYIFTGLSGARVQGAAAGITDYGFS